MNKLSLVAQQPIGVFDSGLGGLTVVRQLQAQLPSEDIIYFGDTARVPYGTKSRSAIIRFSCENAEVLLRHHVKMVVVACNSSSSYAIPTLRRHYDIPVIGVIESGVSRALQQTKTGRVGVIATTATVESRAYQNMLVRKQKGVVAVAQPCPLFVPLVEEGWTENRAAYQIAKQYLSVLRQKKVDVVILGCTHYPLLKATVQKVMGKKVFLVDSAYEVAVCVQQELIKQRIENMARKKGRTQIFVSDRPQRFEVLARRFLGKNMKQVRRISHV